MEPYYESQGIKIYNADCRDILPTLGEFDAVVTDPPYPEIDRDYGRLTEPEWHSLMRDVVRDVRSGLSGTGSAVFILQPNSERVGRMRPWLWEFMAWTAKDWNQIQDAWWWNNTCPPTGHCHRDKGLMRPSLKACVWLGDPNCYRDQSVVLLPISDATKAIQRHDMDLNRHPSGLTVRPARMASAAFERGGSTPYNLLVCPNSDSSDSAGARGHGAGTPRKLVEWWTRYIVPDSGIVVDPFCGSGTMAAVAHDQGLRFVGIEKEEQYCEIIAKRLQQKTLQFE